MDSKRFLVVLHFFNGDAPNALKNLELCKILDGQVPFNCLVATERGTVPYLLEKVTAAARTYFEHVDQFVFDPPPVAKWPEAPNWCWQRVAWEIRRFGVPWFWWEMDAIPLQAQWLLKLQEEYDKGGKPFMGHIVEGMGHMNGCGIYPSDIYPHTTLAAIVRAQAWDVAMKDEMIGKCHNANHLIGHLWGLNKDGQPFNHGTARPVSFPDWNAVMRWVDFNWVLFHRAKDITLANRLIEYFKMHGPGHPAALQNTPTFTKDPTDTPIATTTSETVTISTVLSQSPPKVIPSQPIEGTPVVEFFMCCFHRDLPWLEYCLKAIDKFCRGFKGVAVACPSDEADAFRWAVDQHKVRLIPYDEVPNKGMLHHMSVIMHADRYIEPGTDLLAFMDPDCIFHTPSTPWNYITDGRPHWVIRTYESLMDRERKVESDCYQWRIQVERALGFTPKWYSMCRHPTLFPPSLLPHLREFIEKHVGKSCHDYIMEQQNEFPQTFAEFPTMGAWAVEYARDHFFWIDNTNGFAPIDRLRAHWARGGLDMIWHNNRPVRQDLEEWIAEKPSK